MKLETQSIRPGTQAALPMFNIWCYRSILNLPGVEEKPKQRYQTWPDAIDVSRVRRVRDYVRHTTAREL